MRQFSLTIFLLQVYSLGKLNNMDLYNILILGYCGKETSESYFEAFFESTTIDWKDFLSISTYNYY